MNFFSVTCRNRCLFSYYYAYTCLFVHAYYVNDMELSVRKERSIHLQKIAFFWC